MFGGCFQFCLTYVKIFPANRTRQGELTDLAFMRGDLSGACGDVNGAGRTLPVPVPVPHP